MSKVNIACLIAPMIDTEGPMNLGSDGALEGAKRIIGKYGEIGLETAITFGTEHPDQTHLDILSIGDEKSVTSIQQNAIAMIQPATHPGTLGVHALHVDSLDKMDPFAISELLVAMIEKLDQRPDLIFAGRESWDYAHGVVGAAVAQKLGMGYYSGVNNLEFNDDLTSMTATFLQGNDKLVYDIKLPAIFGTTDWLNEKDSARFTSLKGVMMAKRFKRNIMTLDELGIAMPDRTLQVLAAAPVTSDRKLHRIEDGEGPDKVSQALSFLIDQDKAMSVEGGAGRDDDGGSKPVSWSDGDVAQLALADDLIVVADHDGDRLRMSTLQAIAALKPIADESGKAVSVVLLGDQIDKIAADLATAPISRIVGIQSDLFKQPNISAYAHALERLMNGSTPSIMGTVATDFGRDLAAHVATKSNGGALQDVVSLKVTDGQLIADRVVSNARFVLTEAITAKCETKVVSVRATAFDALESNGSPDAIRVDLAGEPSLRAIVKEFEAGVEAKGIPLNEARIVVAGGRGMKGAENFAHLETLAGLLGGAVGASRAVTDLGWVPHNLQIGQTGTTVAPDVYFAIGISGAIQHLTGMLDSKYIVAINSDPEAPIHQHADISIVDRWENVMEPLIAAFKQALGK